jgi:hypothetical protein
MTDCLVATKVPVTSKEIARISLWILLSELVVIAKADVKLACVRTVTFTRSTKVPTAEQQLLGAEIRDCWFISFWCVVSGTAEMDGGGRSAAA